MKETLSTIIFVLLFYLSAFSQENSNCPNIEIIAPDSITYTGEIMTFSFSEKVKIELENAEIKWSVDKGKIVKGQGTSKIEVDTKEVEDAVITANLEISNLSPNCKNSFSAKGIAVLRTGETIQDDQYGNLTIKEELLRLDIFLVELVNLPEFQGYIVMSYEKDNSLKRAKDRVRTLVKHLKYRGFPPERITFLFDKITKEDKTVLWKFPKNVKFTRCENCERIEVSK